MSAVGLSDTAEGSPLVGPSLDQRDVGVSASTVTPSRDEGADARDFERACSLPLPASPEGENLLEGSDDEPLFRSSDKTD